MQYFKDGTAWQDKAGYTRAVRSGDIIAVSGTTASAPDGTALHPGDTGAQARVCLERIEQALTALGGALRDVIRTVVYLAPGADWERAAEAHRAVFDEIRPANTTLYVARLVGDDLLVEIQADALVTT